ncbi:hypothetical protein ACVIN2_003157 [Bradyrhizobium sp. USDA 3650]
MRDRSALRASLPPSVCGRNPRRSPFKNLDPDLVLAFLDELEESQFTNRRAEPPIEIGSVTILNNALATCD